MKQKHSFSFCQDPSLKRKLFYLILAALLVVSLLLFDLYLVMRPHFLHKVIQSRFTRFFSHPAQLGPSQISLSSFSLSSIFIPLPKGKILFSKVHLTHSPYLALLGIYLPQKMVVEKARIHYPFSPSLSLLAPLGKKIWQAAHPLQEIHIKKLFLHLGESPPLELQLEDLQLELTQEGFHFTLQNHLLFGQPHTSSSPWDAFSLLGQFKHKGEWEIQLRIENLSLRPSQSCLFLFAPRLAPYLLGSWEIEGQFSGTKKEEKSRLLLFGYNTQWQWKGKKFQKVEFQALLTSSTFEIDFCQGLLEKNFFQVQGKFKKAWDGWRGTLEVIHPTKKTFTFSEIFHLEKLIFHLWDALSSLSGR